MSYVIYETNTTYLARIFKNGYWQDAKSATKSGATRMFNNLVKAGKIDPATHRIVETSIFHAQIEKFVEKTNLLSGKKFVQRVNTPASCDPSTETYHSM